MIPIEQTKLGYGGNCYAACVASILECDLDHVPQVHLDEDGVMEDWNESYMPRLNLWLSHMNLWIQPNITFPDGGLPRGYTILSAQSKRVEGYLHAMVALNGHVVWDPHPGRDEGFGDTVCWDLFCTLDAAKVPTL